MLTVKQIEAALWERSQSDSAWARVYICASNAAS